MVNGKVSNFLMQFCHMRISYVGRWLVVGATSQTSSHLIPSLSDGREDRRVGNISLRSRGAQKGFQARDSLLFSFLLWDSFNHKEIATFDFLAE